MLIIIFLSSFFLTDSSSTKTIRYKSADGLEITADLYMPLSKSAPFIVLFHQAGWSRGEYLEIAPKLNALGFNCMAVDQRSGGGINDVVNQTKRAASEKGLATQYVDAIPDMLASIDYAKKHYAEGKLIIWGSSYSSALSLRLAGLQQDKLDGVLAFAPGEYFSRQGKSKRFVREGAKKITIPVFITSAKNEQKNWQKIYDVIPSKKKQYFLPKTAGNHGSRALWDKFEDSKEYWLAVKAFLKQF